MRKPIFLTVVLALTGLAGPAHADIYSFTDEDGTVHFSNVPDDPRYTLLLPFPRPAAPPAAGKPAEARLANQRRYRPLVEEAARIHRIETALLDAVITAESGYDPNAVSRKGAAGLMQLMPETARRYGVSDPYDPAQNIHGGARYLRDLMQMFNNDLNLVLAAYNAGEKTVARYGNRIPPYQETIHYVPKVIKYYRKNQANM